MEKLKEGIDLNSRQLDAFYSALKGRNIFITGPAGEQSLNIDVFFSHINFQLISILHFTQGPENLSWCERSSKN